MARLAAGSGHPCSPWGSSFPATAGPPAPGRGGTRGRGRALRGRGGRRAGRSPELADRVTRLLPGSASGPHKEPRAANQYPIAGLEREPRRRLGDASPPPAVVAGAARRSRPELRPVRPPRDSRRLPREPAAAGAELPRRAGCA